ncbi:MAG: hypothetical protein Q7V61_06430 [Actinomycetota bacterium]|nr:hypothetical protein [Actinomycetota bacterium]
MSVRESAAVRTDLTEAAGVDVVPGPNLVLGGLEAFSHPELPALVVAAAAAGFVRIGLETGGGPLNVGENAAGAIHVGVRHLVIRFVPSVADDDPVATPIRASDAALAGIRAFLGAAAAADQKVAVSAVVPACRHTAPLLPVAVAELADAGVGAVRLVADGEGAYGSAAIAHVSAACDTGVVNGVWVEVEGIVLPKSHAAHCIIGDGR